MVDKSMLQSPQHNGVAERMNRTITERRKCMLSHAKLPKSFLAEAIRTEVYLINLSNLAWMEPEFGRGKMYLTVTQILAAAAGHFGIFLKMNQLHISLMTRLNSASSWVMVIDMNNWATGYWIQFLHLKFMMITDEPKALRVLRLAKLLFTLYYLWY